MMYHARTNSKLRSRLLNHEIKHGRNIESLVPMEEEEAFEVIQEILNFILHLADISHNARNMEISEIWVSKLSEEFWLQGDEEKSLGLPISFLCDRETANVPKSQIGFLKGVIVPSYEIMIDMFPELSFMMNNIQNNIEIWVKREKEQMEKLSLAKEQSPNKRKKIAFNLKEEKETVQTKIEETLHDEDEDKAVNYETKFTAINLDNTTIEY